MTFPLPGAQIFGDVTLGAVLAAAKQLGLPEPAARCIVQEVTSRVEKTFAILVEEHEAGTQNAPPERAVYTMMAILAGNLSPAEWELTLMVVPLSTAQEAYCRQVFRMIPKPTPKTPCR